MNRTYNPCDECRYSYSKQNQGSNMCKICEFKKMLDLEEQGNMLKLPCKEGSTVYYITGSDTHSSIPHFNRVEKSKVRGFYFDEKGVQIRLNSDCVGNHGTYCRFGKTVFRTKEEAEAALSELQR